MLDGGRIVAFINGDGKLDSLIQKTKMEPLSYTPRNN